MNRAMAYGTLLAYIVAAIAIIAARPDWLGDTNRFLRDFVNHEFVNVLGVTLAITLASAAQIHLALNRIEERVKVKDAFSETRRELHQDTYWLISYFVVGVVIVVVKPIIEGGTTMQAAFNAAALFVLLLHVLVLVSLTQLVFAMPPVESNSADDREDEQSEPPR